MYNLKVKICGIKNSQNRMALEDLSADIFGFIFYERSLRYVGEHPQEDLFDTKKQKTAVFVNHTVDMILEFIERYNFDAVQMHGGESPQICQLIRSTGVKVIKAFNIDENFNFSTINDFVNSIDYLLFDTRSDQPGGSGEKYDWNILQKYEYEMPFFLSGGISPDDADIIRSINHPSLYGVDLNSGFEDSPGIKNINKVKRFLLEINK